MSVIEGRSTSAVLMMLLCTAMFCSGYNVDIKSAVVHRGPDRSKFGYQAEFIKQTTGPVKLFVTAPHQEVLQRERSGHYYLSDPLMVLSREHSNTLPFDRHPELGNVVSGHFGEEMEMFGQTLLLVNRSTALVCGPFWNDIIGWNSEYPFPVGRCQLVPPGNGSLALPQNQSTYIGTINVDGGWVRGFIKGFAQFGFSAANLKDGKVIVGIPGFANARGTFGVLNLNNGQTELMEGVFDIHSYVYLGFAVAGGNLCRGTKVCFAASNRMSNGTVYVVEWDTLSGFRLLRLLQSPQDYSSYGFSLCSMDINGDGLSDLLVGTPAYSDHSKSPSSYDEGRVYVYLHLQSVQENFLDNITLAGDRKMFARFGSAIGDIGDINRDLIHDVAVGAPEEDDGRGAVYIYLGSSKGPETTFSQRISGKDIDESLFSFGSHISRSTTATSPYNYPDFAVGSPESNAVVVLRTRLIVNAKANIITPASPINSSNDNCPAPARNPAFKASGCIMLQLCLSFSAEDPRGHYRNLSFDVSFEIDTLLSYDVVRRVRLLTNGQTETSVKETLTVNAGQVDCKTYDAILREDQIFRNPFIPVKMKATFALNVTSLQQPLKPVLNPSLPNETTTELRFINKCGEDQTCNADLVLEGRVTHEPVERDMNLNIVNITSEVKLDLTLVNKQETAYGVKITTQIQGRIRFRFATGEQGVSHVSCEAKDRDNTTVGSLVTCNSWSPLAQDEVLPVRLVFDAVSVPLEDTSRVISFEVRAMPSDPLQNPEVNDKDNVVTLNSTKVIVAEVHIDGSSDPKALYVIDSNVPELVAVQRLLVTNHGPSFLPPTYVNISLPYKDMEGRELLTSHNVSIKHQDGSEMQCTPTSVSDASLLTTTRTPPSTASTPATPLTSSPGTATTTQKPMPSGATRTTREPEEPTFGPVDPSRRRRREAGEEKQVETTDNSDQDKGSERSLQINCQTYRCKTFQCNLQTLHRNGQATIMVSLVLNKRVLEVSEKVDAIFYNTSSTVAEPSTPFFYKWSKLPSAKVSTIIYIKSSEGINLWIIIGGILGGIVLLIIIALILKKLGFFRRADKAKLERLKRQSGYYNKRRPPSSAPSPADQKT